MVDDSKSPIVSYGEGNSCVFVDLCKEIYHRDAVLKASYLYTDRFYVKVSPLDEYHVRVAFEAKEGANVDCSKAAKNFCNDVLDQQIREDLAKTNGKIRDIIYKHAFSPLKDVENEL
uniref:His-Xaa-Ser system protein HxsD n=1 Tax=Nitratidesulfovibrio vulgaris (strain DSM 19637 / Miyazaki F) TaxID=883 RepID=B8DIZ9_NITV9